MSGRVCVSGWARRSELVHQSRSRPASLLVLFGVLIVASLACMQGSAGAAGPTHPASVEAGSLGYSLTPSTTQPYAACGRPAPGHAACLSIVIPPGAVHSPIGPLSGRALGTVAPSFEGSGEEGGLSPSDLRSAYKLPETGGSEQTIAIVDAYDDPNAAGDLATYRSRYGLSECTKANHCLKQINHFGEEYRYPEASTSWALETSLDLDMVSAICPECHILLVEAENNEASSLYAAEDEAAAWREPETGRKATEISNSWGGPEYAEETSDDRNFNHPGIPITVAAGDESYQAEYPAASPYVISVGGTTLKKAEKSSRGWEESVWGKSGSGCSAYEPKPAWQGDAGCAKRTDNDVAAVASLESPVSIYDSYERTGWELVGGTSVGAPIVAGVEALSSSTVRAEGPKAFYESALFDVTTGSDGDCGGTYLCTAVAGYDGPTGWGTPDGLLGSAPEFHATTAAATNVTASGAKLNGYVNSAGGKSVYRFEYGPTTSYGTNVPIPNGSIGASVAWQAVSQSITGLHVTGIYHYRIAATNGRGTTSYGEDQTFATTPWTVQSAPKEGSESRLEAVSCTSAEACTAVSSYASESESTRWALIERWNGTEWARQSSAKPTGATYSWLFGVSCMSSTTCAAVGFYINGSESELPLAERWNGTEWTVQTIPGPTGGKSDELHDVSCVSSSECVAVGSYLNSTSVTVPLAERWNGTEWTVQTIPSPTGAKESSLRSVSCASSSECIAVGSYLNSSAVTVPLAERWNGTAWTVQTIPSPAGAKRSSLRSVSCAATHACTAVGYYTSSSNTEIPLAERWNGTEWTIQTTPTLVAAEANLGGVSCSASTECIAVGASSSTISTLSERWNGTEWALEAMPWVETPPGFGGASLVSVSCSSSKACAAVGSRVWTAGGSLGYAEPLAESRAIPRPYAETGQATSVHETTATLNGVINPEGSETKYDFEYGLTTSYGTKTAEIAVGAGTSNLEEAKTISGLHASTIYHFRIAASSSGGTTYGADHVFTTSGVLPTLQPAGGSGAFPVAFTSTGGKTVIGTESGKSIKCSAETSAGSFTNVKEGKDTLKLTGCEAAGVKCSSGEKAGEIETKELKSLLAYTYPAKTTLEGRETGLVLSPASGEVVAEFSCSAKKLVVRGSLIAVVSPLRASTKTLALTTKGAGGVQEPAEYETVSGGKVAAGLTCAENGLAAEKCSEEENTTVITPGSEEVTVATEGGSALPTLLPSKARAFPVAFTSTGGKTVIGTESGKSIKCSAETSAGSFTNVKEGKDTLKLTGCEAAGVKCSSGEKAGEIETKELKSLLAYTYPAKTTLEGRETGLVLSPASGEVVAEFSCSAKKLVVRGSLIAVVSPLKMRTKTLAVTIKETGGVQEPSAYETEGAGKVAAGLTCAENGKAAEKCTAEEVAPVLTLTSEEGTIEA